MMRLRRLYPLLLLAVFLIGCLGHLLLRPKEEVSSPYYVTFSSENVNNLLLYSLPNLGETLCFSGISGRVTHISHAPCTLFARREGESISYVSLLYSDLKITLSVSASQKNGRLSIEGKPLFLGDNVTLLGTHFSLSARFSEFVAAF